MACAFCLTGKMGLVRNLTAGEIAGQVRVLAGALDMRDKRFNIVLMGMGEPLHNYDETMRALRILNDEHGLAMSPRRVTLSTVGLLPALERLAREPIMPNLAISLHAPDRRAARRARATQQEVRRSRDHRRLQAFSAQHVAAASRSNTCCSRASTIRPRTARQLAKLLAGVKSKVNLIPLNAAAGHSVRAAVRRSGRSLRADSGRTSPARVGEEEPRDETSAPPAAN